MKHVIGLIFSLGVLTGVAADCNRLDARAETTSIWASFVSRFGGAKLPGGFQLCIGRHYFHEIKGGARMASALDRRSKRIVLRRIDTDHLRHELAHLYLDTAWKVLPYRISEEMVAIMVRDAVCAENLLHLKGNHEIRSAWKHRNNLSECDAEALLRGIISAPQVERDALPLY